MGIYSFPLMSIQHGKSVFLFGPYSNSKRILILKGAPSSEGLAYQKKLPHQFPSKGPIPISERRFLISSHQKGPFPFLKVASSSILTKRAIPISESRFLINSHQKGPFPFQKDVSSSKGAPALTKRAMGEDTVLTTAAEASVT